MFQYVGMSLRVEGRRVIRRLLTALNGNEVKCTRLDNCILTPRSLCMRRLRSSTILTISTVVRVTSIFCHLVGVILGLIINCIGLRLTTFLPYFRALRTVLLRRLLRFVRRRRTRTVRRPNFRQRTQLSIFRELRIIFTRVRVMLIDRQRRVRT